MDFSIEQAAERIADSRTRGYFGEVYSSFVNGNNRSAVVMLWSVVVADIVFKLQELRDLHTDPVAKSILDEIGKLVENNPNNPEWELALVESVAVRMYLFEAGDAENLRYLQKLRHLSAHPVLSGINVLFSPTKDQCRSLIRSALESVLLKPPVFSKKIIEHFVEDIATRKKLLPDDQSLEQYLKAKYFSGMHAEVQREVFRTLWKFVFRLSNQDADENRSINCRVLQIMFSANSLDLKKYVQDHQPFFSEIAGSGSPLDQLVEFIGQNPILLPALSEAAKTLVCNRAKADVDLFVRAPFVSNGMSAHIDAAVRSEGLWKLRRASVEAFLDMAASAGLEDKACCLPAAAYYRASCFDDADNRFEAIVEPFLPRFGKESLTALLEGIESNGQTYGRGRARSQHQIVLAQCKKVFGETFDLGPYPNFKESLPKESQGASQLPA